MREDRRKYWGEIYAEWKSTSLNCRAFCTERGLSYDNMRYWARRIEGEAASGAVGSFVEISSRRGETQALYELVLSNGRELRIPERFMESQLKRLIAVCEAC